MKDEILDLLILGGYGFREVAEMLEISVAEVRNVYRENMDY